MKSCFPQAHLAIRADRRVVVDLGPCSGFYKRQIEKEREGQEPVKKGGRQRGDMSTVDPLSYLPKRKNRGIKLMSSKND